MESRTTLLVSAGERSGDTHAANLVRELLSACPELRIEGFGGELLQAAGCHVHEDLVALASMGLGFRHHLRRYMGVLRKFQRLLADLRPAAVILVDSPGLNFALARLARWSGVPVIYYICPQIWAWAPWRRSKVLKYTDLLLVILPFEEDLYRNPKVPVRFVGHPLADSLAKLPATIGDDLRARLRIPPGDRVVGILPGSREHEVRELMPLFREILNRMHLDPHNHRVIVSALRESFRDPMERLLWGCQVPHEVCADDSRSIIAASDMVLVASGTASLEVAYFEKPMLVLYRAGWLGQAFFRLFGVTPYISLPNILGAHLRDGEPLVLERVCHGDEADELAPFARAILEPGPARERIVEDLRRFKAEVFVPGANARAAEAVLRFLAERAS